MTRILVGEDDHDVSVLLTMVLADAGYAVELRGTGVDVLAAYETERPDIVLLDVTMPGALDGIAVLRRIRAVDADVPVVLLTAKAREGDRVDGLRAGADDYVVKPFDVDDLLTRVAALAERRS